MNGPLQYGIFCMVFHALFFIYISMVQNNKVPYCERHGCDLPAFLGVRSECTSIIESTRNEMYGDRYSIFVLITPIPLCTVVQNLLNLVDLKLPYST